MAHEQGLKVILDATVGTPFLIRPLQRENPDERPDYVIHSYTKDISGCGGVIAGCVIGRNQDMFVPKGESAGGVNWDQTMFWNVYYVKGAFLNADGAFEVMQGMKTMTMRMLRKCINTKIMADFLNSHPEIRVNSNWIPSDPNHDLLADQLYLGMPAPLFTFDMGDIPRDAFQRFFDSLSPMFGHMISLGQSNTIVSCPALTTHSELNEQALAEAGMTPTTIRCAVGDEDPLDLISHLINAAKGTIDIAEPGYADQFMSLDDIKSLIRRHYVDTHAAYVDNQVNKA